MNCKSRHDLELRLGVHRHKRHRRSSEIAKTKWEKKRTRSQKEQRFLAATPARTFVQHAKVYRSRTPFPSAVLLAHVRGQFRQGGARLTRSLKQRRLTRGFTIDGGLSDTASRPHLLSVMLHVDVVWTFRTSCVPRTRALISAFLFFNLLPFLVFYTCATYCLSPEPVSTRCYCRCSLFAPPPPTWSGGNAEEAT